MLNIKGEVEMDAFVMDGKTLANGAVSAVRNIANPIQLARLVMDKVYTLTQVNGHKKNITKTYVHPHIYKCLLLH